MAETANPPPTVKGDSKRTAVMSDQEIVARILGTSVAQANWYAANPEEMYFMVKQDVMHEFSNQIEYDYACYRGTNKGVYIRDDYYVSFYQWFKSDEFTKHVGVNYTFSDPYLVGRAWTPIRTDDATVDVYISVRGKKSLLPAVPQRVRDQFVEAFSRKFATEEGEEVLVKHNRIFLTTPTLKITITLVVEPNPPFAVLLTSALNQYDDFFDNFSAMSFFIHRMFLDIRNGCQGTQRLVVPSSHSINCLIIFFLQFYEMIPHFFQSSSHSESYLQSHPMEDIIKYKYPAYHPSMYQHFKDFENLRRDRKPKIGEVVLMFFFFYGYLIDLPHQTLNVITTEVTCKEDIDSVALSITTVDTKTGSEVPDAYRLQNLFREAFNLVKDAQNPHTVTKRLCRMRLDDSFYCIRDRIMRSTKDTFDVVHKAWCGTTDHILDEKYHLNAREVHGMIVTDCNPWIRYRRKETQDLYGKRFPKKPFSDSMHQMKTYFRRPTNYQNCRTIPTLEHLQKRAGRMFMTTVLANPNNHSELSVIFRPPNCKAARLRPVVDPVQELSMWSFEMPYHREPNFFELARMGCYEHMREIELSKKLGEGSSWDKEDQRWIRLREKSIRENYATERNDLVTEDDDTSGEDERKMPTPIEARDLSLSTEEIPGTSTETESNATINEETTTDPLVVDDSDATDLMKKLSELNASDLTLEEKEEYLKTEAFSPYLSHEKDIVNEKARGLAFFVFAERLADSWTNIELDEDYVSAESYSQTLHTF
ncbi:hypothetical protein GCK72_006497 [Caenorhabditis remanei]|uniref:Uncharacterized protein n=1 Tax=Caenorhabditis remanei TaxID=31234 RepID=A0A6A5HF72_CAERE|nr:hypothetical protein GCK72_006497 [Caenorhabditis remanei]KAF1766540.1 hypothetical protein GCK72_006497 [Caenorhabditis remanei]